MRRANFFFQISWEYLAYLMLVLLAFPVGAQPSYLPKVSLNSSMFQCADSTEKLFSEDPMDLVDSFVAANLKMKDSKTTTQANNCAIHYAFRLNDILENYLRKEDIPAYENFFQNFNNKIREAHLKDLELGTCSKDPKLSIEEIPFCLHEGIYVQLSFSFQETWSNFYIDYITSEKFKEELIAMAKVGGASVSGVLGVVFLSHKLKYMNYGKHLNQVATKFISRFIRRVGFSTLRSTGRSLGTSFGRTTLVAGTGSVGAISNQYQKEGSLNFTPQYILPAPLALVEFSKVPGHEFLDEDEDFYKDLYTLFEGTLAFGVVPALAMEVGFSKALSLLRLNQKGRFLVAAGKKPTMLALGFLVAGWGFQAINQCQVNEEKERLDQEILNLKNAIKNALKNNQGYLAYQKSAELTQKTTQKALMYAIPFLSAVQDLHTKHMARYHCLPLNQDYNVSDPNLEEAIFQVNKEDLKNDLHTVRTEFENSEGSWLGRLNQGMIDTFQSQIVSHAIECPLQADPLLESKNFHEAVAQTLSSTTDFLWSLKRPELKPLMDRLASFNSYYKMQAQGSQLEEYWAEEGKDWYQKSKVVREDLIQFADNYFIHKGDPKMDWTPYEKSIDYIQSYSDFRVKGEQKGFNCYINLDALSFVPEREK